MEEHTVADAPRVLVINPNTSTSMTRAIGEIAHSARARADITVVSPRTGPLTVESEADSALAATMVADLVWRNRSSYDAFVIACFDDPGLAASRSLVSLPVIGIAQAASAIARVVGGPWGVLVVRDGVVDRVRHTLGGYDLDLGRTSFASLAGRVADLGDPGVTERFVMAGRRLVEDGARCIILACAGFAVHAGTMSRELGVPVLDGTVCAVGLVTALLDLKEVGLLDLTGQREVPSPVTGPSHIRVDWKVED